MSGQAYLIDTNVIIGLEDNHTVQPVLSEFVSLASKHKVDIFIHAASKDDVKRDKNRERRNISLSKLEKFQSIDKVKDLTKDKLEGQFGKLSKPNDVVDATLLHAVEIGAVDFLVTQDRGLHERARKSSSELSRRVLFVPDAVQLLKTTYEAVEVPIRYVEEVAAHTIPLEDDLFNSLREGYEKFDDWWRTKCVAARRSCWVVYDNGLAGLVVRKDESKDDTDATQKFDKILKICTFKVRPEKRGVKLGELLLKQVFWFAQSNNYDLVYLTTFSNQTSLINLIEYYGFIKTHTRDDGELIFEKKFGHSKVDANIESDIFEIARLYYPRFYVGEKVEAFVIPILESNHDVLYPDLRSVIQGDLFEDINRQAGLGQPGNTIRKVYLCRAKSRLGSPGSILFFYKGKSKSPPSQAITAVAILEDVNLAESTKELMQLTGGRSVYSESQLAEWDASPQRRVKVINYLLAAYIDPPITKQELLEMGIFRKCPPQSISGVEKSKMSELLIRSNLGFSVH